VLEVGCGDGKTLRTIAGSKITSPDRGVDSPEIVGLDFSRAAIRFCTHTSFGNARIHLVCADAARMPFPDSSFDTVLLFHVLGHASLQKRRKICDEVHRVVGQGGCVILRVFSTRDFRSGKGEEIEETTYLRGDGTFTHYFTKKEIIDLNPLLSLVSMDTPSWNLKVLERDFVREEIHAILRKKTS